MTRPMASQTTSRNQVSKGINTIMPKQVRIPSIGIKGTSGTLNGRSALGSVFLRMSMPTQTIRKASKVPILVISPTTVIGTKAANKAMNMQSMMFDL